MEHNLAKMSGRRLTTFILLLSIVSLNFTPLMAEKAQAQFVVNDPPLTAIAAAQATRETGRHVSDSAAMIAARLAIQQIVNSTVNWAQSGFDGNPAYVTDPKQYFTDLSDGIAGDFIAGSELNFLCSPFQTQIRLALRNQYLQGPQYQCTLTGVVANIDAFYNNFNQGGWDAWFAMTQTSGGNPYDAFLEAQVALDSRIASAVGLQNQQVDWNQGFFSYQVCDGLTTTASLSQSGQEECTDEFGNLTSKRTVTPGTTIKNQLDKVLPSGLESLITVNHVEQLIQAFATGLLNRYVFGSQGLFAKGSAPATDNPSGSGGGAGARPLAPGEGFAPGAIDIDGDNLPDLLPTGTDGDYLCIYEGLYPSCAGSIETAAKNAAQNANF